MATQILRLPRTDVQNAHLLVQVTRTNTKSLDLKLVGTEHEHIYHADIEESQIKTLQANNYSGNLEEWRQVLRHVLLHEHPASDTTRTDVLQGLETVAAISKSALTITIRKNVGGITQRLGSISLDQNDELEEVSPFDWVDTAVANSDDLRQQLDTLQASVSGQQDEVSRLTKQLDELVQAKKDHEAELLTKFAVLLNEKKLKIRDQQRLLSGAKIDPEVAEATGKARNGDKGKARTAKGSRKGKRKAEEVDSEGDQEMADGNAEDAGEEEEEDRHFETPPRSVAGEDTDEDGLNAPGPAPPRSQNSKQTGEMNVDEELELPPRRELPFKFKGSASAASAPAAAPDDDDGDDDTDDEL